MDNEQKETLLYNYVDLFAFICTKKEIEEDKLKVLEIKAKCLYAKTNPEESVDLQAEIRASKAFLERCDKLCIELGDKYKKLALSLSNANCMLFSAIFFEGKTPKQAALEFGVSLDYVYKKKAEFQRMIIKRINMAYLNETLKKVHSSSGKTQKIAEES